MSSSPSSFHFGTQEYTQCFLNLPVPDVSQLRQSTIDYLDHFDPALWYEDPIVSLLNGEKLRGEKDSIDDQIVDTVNALGKVNGKQIFASRADIQRLKEHIMSYSSSSHDLRDPVRAIEHELLTTYAGELIGNQCLDFAKQDGITEMEEATMANAVERRLNDLLLRDEAQKKVVISRKPIFISCVSNFTNFLDLFRKTLRSIEVGIPCIVLGRSNTSQHTYRWTLLLQQLFASHNIDAGMITFLSCSLDDIRNITVSCQHATGNLYATCSRSLASIIKADYPNTIASTGGPNTLVVATGDALQHPAVQQAIQTSASIECAGQCTALRHCVVPSSTPETAIKDIFSTVRSITNASDAVKQGAFDAVFDHHEGSSEPQDTASEKWHHHDQADVFYQLDDKLPSSDLEEYWRKVVVNFTRMDVTASKTSDVEVVKKQQDQLAAWLNESQPISLAVNGPRDQAIKLGINLFEHTGMVVYTIGSSDDESMPPALTCQARPQEAEIFGEFPQRVTLSNYTKFPVFVPGSNPSYDAVYSHEYLLSQKASEAYSKKARCLIAAVESDLVKGFCVIVIEYLREVTRTNPKLGFGKRTTLWGLQRPPLHQKTLIRCSKQASWDDICPIILLFQVTNAQPQSQLSFDRSIDKSILQLCQDNKLSYTVETQGEMLKRIDETKSSWFNNIHIEGDSDAKRNKPIMKTFPMVEHFTSLYLPLGHIKSTKQNDREFTTFAQLSDKWLQTLF